jgi:hypothetical protein
LTTITEKGNRPVLDEPSAVEFMREALVKLSETEIAVVSSELERRRELLLPRLQKLVGGMGDENDLKDLWRGTFVTRRNVDELLESGGVEGWSERLEKLVSGDEDLCSRVSAFAAEPFGHDASFRRDLAGEMLRLHDPDKYWLCSRWMWNEKTKTGSLPLVLVEGYDLEGSNPGEIYLKVGEALKVVQATAAEIGFGGMRASRYAIDVYLCAIYGVYLYTVTRLRMTQEFNTVIPKLPELVRRMLAVHRLEVTQ